MTALYGGRTRQTTHPARIHANSEGTSSSIMTSSIMIRFPRTIGHRGARGYAPENTLAGIRTAAEQGVCWVEVDVKLTRDGVPILMHDDTVDRTTDGRGAVASMDFADLRRLDAGKHFGPQFAGEKHPDAGGNPCPDLRTGPRHQPGDQALPRPGGGNRPHNAGYRPLPYGPPTARRPLSPASNSPALKWRWPMRRTGRAAT